MNREQIANMRLIDNLMLIVGTFLAGIVGFFEGTQIALVIFAVAALLKAIFSAIDPEIPILSIHNIDNIILGVSAGLAATLAVTHDATIAFWLMVAGGMAKAIGSAIDRQGSTIVNVDNVLMAIFTFVAGILASLGYTQASLAAAGMATIAKGLLSTWARERAIIDQQTTMQPISN